MLPVRALEALALVSQALAFAVLTRRFMGSAVPGAWAGALAVLIHARLEFWHTGQPETFSGPVLAWALVLATNPTRKTFSRAAAGALFGFAAFLKPPLGGGVVLVPAILAWRDARATTTGRARAVLEPFAAMAFGALARCRSALSSRPGAPRARGDASRAGPHALSACCSRSFCCGPNRRRTSRGWAAPCPACAPRRPSFPRLRLGIRTRDLRGFGTRAGLSIRIRRAPARVPPGPNFGLSAAGCASCGRSRRRRGSPVEVRGLVRSVRRPSRPPRGTRGREEKRKIFLEGTWGFRLLHAFRRTPTCPVGARRVTQGTGYSPSKRIRNPRSPSESETKRKRPGEIAGPFQETNGSD